MKKLFLIAVAFLGFACGSSETQAFNLRNDAGFGLVFDITYTNGSGADSDGQIGINAGQSAAFGNNVQEITLRSSDRSKSVTHPTPADFASGGNWKVVLENDQLVIKRQ